MANTTNLNLEKPLGTDQALVSVINSNSDKIDAFAGTTNQALSNFTSTTPTAITDFNSAITPGYYRAGSTAANAPTSGYWTVSVFPFSPGDLAQLALEVNLRIVYIRTLHDSTTWTTWQELALKSNMTERASLWAGSLLDGDSVTFSESLSNFVYALLVFHTNQEYATQLIPTANISSSGIKITQLMSGANNSGQQTFPLPYNGMQIVNLALTGVSDVQRAHNNVNYTVKLSNVYGIMRK